MNITEFLLARIDEDEQIARSAAESIPPDYLSYRDSVGATWEDADGLVKGGPDRNGYAVHLWDCEGSDTLCMAPAASTHVARHDPARVLAECAAKREMIEHAADATEFDQYIRHERPSVDDWPDLFLGDFMLRTLASVYKDHPDYQQEWQ